MRHILSLLTISCLVVLSASGCKKASGMNQELLYVDTVDGPQSSHVGEPVVLTIRGNQPDPSWKLDDPEVSRDGLNVTVLVRGHKVKNTPVVMVLIPFTTTATLSDLPPGKITIEVHGRQQTLTHAVLVSP